MALLRWWRRTVDRLRGSRQSDALEAEIDAELADHLASAAAHLEAQGLPPEAARRAALLELRGMVTREAVQDVRRARWLEDFGRDVRYGARTLARAPTFTLVALATLTIGIGATTAVFTAVNGTLLQPLPFGDPDRLYAAAYAPVTGPFRPGASLLDADFLPFHNAQRIFTDVAASNLGVTGATLTGAGEPVRLRRLLVTANYFSVLGVTPLLGRTFAPGDGEPGRDQLVILDATVWRERFGADPQITSRIITLDGQDYHVIGVAPPGLTLHRAEIWTPVTVRPMPGRLQFLEVIGRLPPGTSPQAAESAFQAFIRQEPVDPTAPKRGHEWVARLTPVQDLVVAKARLPLEVFAGAVACVLLIACVNVANLQLVRAAARTREIAVRTALGAARARLIRQLLTESTLLALAGGLGGLTLAAFGVRALHLWAPLAALPRPDMVRIDGVVLGFVAAISVLTGLGFGLVPAFQSTRPARRDVLRAAERGGSVSGERTRAILAAAEVALALVLLAGGMLLLRSFLRLEAVDPGFGVDHRLVASLSLPAPAYASVGRIEAFDGAVVERLGSLAGVEAVAVVNDRPLGNNWTMGDFTLRGGKTVPPGWAADKLSVSPGYFRTMAIPMLAGRDFTAADDANAAPVALVSESVVRAIWPDGRALGEQVSEAEHPTPTDWVTIVGVVADVTQIDLTQGRRPALYRPLAQTTHLGFVNHASFIVRSTADPATLGPAVRAAIHQVDATIPIETLATLPNLVTATTAAPRFQTWLIGVFATVAVLLAAIGVSGVLAYSVALRAREIGIRRALGASTSEVVGLVLQRTVKVAGVGLAVGLGAAWLLSRVLASVLFEVRPHDLTTFVVATVLLALVALVAAIGPAWRARAVSPIEALRLP